VPNGEVVFLGLGDFAGDNAFTFRVDFNFLADRVDPV
jgi:hypothetical protein